MKAIILLIMTCAVALSASALGQQCDYFNSQWNTCITPTHLMDICPVSCDCETTPGVSSGGSSKHTFGYWLAEDEHLLYDYSSYNAFLDTTKFQDLEANHTVLSRDLRIVEQHQAWIDDIIYHKFGYTPPTHLWS